jgi:predicted permease
MPAAPKLYRLLLRLYPASFRERYQGQMERYFLDEYAATSSAFGRLKLWMRELFGLAISIPMQTAVEAGQDLRYSLRVYRGRSFSAVLAVAALALAIGASTGVFSVVNALLLGTLPFRDPASLVELQRVPVRTLSPNTFRDWESRAEYLSHASVFGSSEMNLSVERESLRANVTETSANFFDTMGMQPIAGRAFAAGEDTPGAPPLAVISYGVWNQSFGADPRAIGSTLDLNGTAATIIGVAPPRFDYPGKTAIWVSSFYSFNVIPKRTAYGFEFIARLKPGVTLAQARQMFLADSERTIPRDPREPENSRATMTPIRDQLAGTVRQASLVFSGIVLLALLAACANVAQLLLSRTMERRHELALRSALGASRARLTQQLITESLALTTLAAALGMGVAYWSSGLATLAAPATLETQSYSVLDVRVLLFAAALSLVTGLLFGVIPGWLLGRFQPSADLVRAPYGGRDSAMGLMRGALLAVQAALTVTLLAGSITMGRSFLKMINMDLGFRPKGVVTVTASLIGNARYKSASDRWGYYSEIADQIRKVEGVQSAGGVRFLPLGKAMLSAYPIMLDTGRQVSPVISNGAMPGYFDAAGVKLLAGRDFAPGDGTPGHKSVIVNDMFAREAGMGSEIVGRSITSPWKEQYLIQGIVETARMKGPDTPLASQIYWPVREEAPGAIMFVAKVSGRAEDSVAKIRDAIRAYDPGVAVYDAKTYEARLDEVLAQPRFYTTAILFFGALAILLAVAGIYGTASFAVAQRTHELGVRMALGASRTSLRMMVIRLCVIPAMIGIVFGIAAAMESGQYLSHLMSSTQALGWRDYSMASAALFAAAATAAWVATERILRIDPVNALRAE